MTSWQVDEVRQRWRRASGVTNSKMLVRSSGGSCENDILRGSVDSTT